MQAEARIIDIGCLRGGENYPRVPTDFVSQFRFSWIPVDAGEGEDIVQPCKDSRINVICEDFFDCAAYISDYLVHAFKISKIESKVYEGLISAWPDDSSAICDVTDGDLDVPVEFIICESESSDIETVLCEQGALCVKIVDLSPGGDTVTPSDHAQYFMFTDKVTTTRKVKHMKFDDWDGEIADQGVELEEAAESMGCSMDEIEKWRAADKVPQKGLDFLDGLKGEIDEL